MKKRNIITMTSLAALFTSGLYAASIKLTASFAFDRYPIMNLFGNGEHTLKGIAKEGQDWLHAHDEQIYYRTSSDGLKLCAHYIPAENATRTVIEFHGWHGSWDVDFSASSPELHKLGCNLLLIEERGQGRSDGEEMTFGVKERGDVMEWVTWYQENIDSTIPLYLAGVSMGAATLLMACADPFPKEVKGIISDCGFTSAYDIIRIVGKKQFHAVEHPTMDTLNLYCKRKYGFSLKDGDARNALKTTKLPILFVHGKADSFVPCWMTAEAYEICASEKDILLVDGAKHGNSFVVDKERYLNKVKTFFEKNDGSSVNICPNNR